MKTTLHQPKGSMCAACIHSGRDCSHLSFKDMPKLTSPQWPVVIVRCTEFVRNP